jgi:ABC-type polysaccharide/polyol phosphate export permease
MNESHTVINQFLDNVQKKYMPIDVAEILLVNPMTDIYNSIRKILKDNDIVTAETLEEQ